MTVVVVRPKEAIATISQWVSRRRFAKTAAGALLIGAMAARGASAQQNSPGKKLVAFLSQSTSESSAGQVAGFLQALRGYGWTDGQQFDFVQRYADGRLDHVPTVAAELASLRPDIILAANVGVVVAGRQQIGKIATVFATGVDPVALGLVQSYRRPGGNVTGVTGTVDDGIYGKRLQLLVEAIHGAVRVGVLINPDAPSGQIARPLIEAAAKILGVELVPFEARTPADFDAAFAFFARERVAALHVATDPVSFAARDKIAALELAAKLPAIHSFQEEAEAGSLMAYGVSTVDNYRRAAFLVHKVLSGTPPGELPIDVAPQITLTINLKTAKALGLTLPESILLRATEFIE